METTLQTRPTPRAKGWPLVGNTFQFVRDPLGYLRHLQQQYDRVVGVTLANRSLTVTFTPDDAKYILQENNKNFHKSEAYKVLQLFLGNGLLTSEGDFWRRQRRLAQPAFHRQRLALLVDAMNEEVREVVERWKQHDPNLPVDISGDMMRLALAIVTRSLFSSNVKQHIDSISEPINQIIEFAYEALFQFIHIPMHYPTPRNLRYKRAVDKIEAVIYGILEQRRAENGAIRHDDLLEMLMEVQDEDTGERMTNQQLRDEVTTIFMAGHETTANALSWALYLLAKNPAVVQKLRAEFDRVLGPTGQPTAESLRELTYTLQVVNETMRLYPPAWVFSRKPLADDMLPSGYPLPAGKGVLVCPYLLHRDPKFWEKPDEFYPDHFLPENVKARPTYAFIPFGAGPRLCIGNNFALMEMQVALVHLVRAFDYQTTRRDVIQPEPGITLRPKGGLRLRIKAV